MGAIRFILACMVLLSHLGLTFFQLNLGVSAVVIFYLLSGHVVAVLWERFKGQPNGIKLFYIDRAWRILPQYFVALICAVALWINGVESPYISATPDIWDWLFNITVIPLNFFMITGREHFILLPPTWSLAAELQFYLIAPVILSAKPRLFLTWFLMSFCIFLFAQFSYVNLQIYGYRLLPGMLFIFLISSVMIDKSNQSKSLWLKILWVSALGYFIFLCFFRNYQAFNREVVLGIIIGIPIIANRFTENLGKYCKNNSQNAWLRFNKILGFLSYGMFLYHFPVIWILNLKSQESNNMFILNVIIISLFFAIIGHYFFERPIWNKFRNLRKDS